MYLVLQFEGFLWHLVASGVLLIFNQAYFFLKVTLTLIELSFLFTAKSNVSSGLSFLEYLGWSGFLLDNQVTLFLLCFYSVLITGDVEKESGINLMTPLLKNLI